MDHRGKKVDKPAGVTWTAYAKQEGLPSDFSRRARHGARGGNGSGWFSFGFSLQTQNEADVGPDGNRASKKKRSIMLQHGWLYMVSCNRHSETTVQRGRTSSE